MKPIIRDLEEKDLSNGFLDLLNSLSSVHPIDEKTCRKRFNQMKTNYYHRIFVAEKNSKLIGTSAILVEPKFFHGGKNVAHLEDLVVENNQQGLGVGSELFTTLLETAKNYGCYKAIFNCPNSALSFYERIGARPFENSMRVNIL